MIESCSCVPSPRDCSKPASFCQIGNRARDRYRALAERWNLKDPKRSVPDESAHLLQFVFKESHRRGTDVENHVICTDLIDRHRARFKYTLDRLGMDSFLELLTQRWGEPLQPPRAFTFTHNGDPQGLQQDSEGLWHATLEIANGRIQGALQDQLQGFVQSFAGYLRLTTNQNLILGGIEPDLLETSQWRLDDLGLAARLSPSLQSTYSLSCVALPTCGLAMAEAERIMPQLLQRFEDSKASFGLQDIPITLRVTGCPNGCARPYIAEIGLTGRAPNLYNLYLGGGFHGERLNQLYASNVSIDRAFELLDPLLARFAAGRQAGEHFGDYLIRCRIVQAIAHGSDPQRMIPVLEEHS